MQKTIECKIKPCEKCGMTGKLRVGNLREAHNEDIETCPYCFGDGSFIQVTTIEIFKKSDEIIRNLIPRA